MNEKSNKSNQLRTILGVAVGILTYFLVQQFLLAPPSLDKVLMIAASEINKSLPIMVDSETQLDNTIALPNNIFQYHYTLINSTVDKIDIEEIENGFKQMLVNNMRNNPDMKNFRENNVTTNYMYRDRNGNFITKISITPSEYK